MAPDAAKRERFDGRELSGRAAIERDAAPSASKAAASDAFATVSSRAGDESRAEIEADADFRSDPDAWYAYIGRLRRVGLHEEADREFAAFRLAFPKSKYAAPAPAQTPAERPADAIAPER
jgi:hypothetical protein